MGGADYPLLLISRAKGARGLIVPLHVDKLPIFSPHWNKALLVEKWLGGGRQWVVAGVRRILFPHPGSLLFKKYCPFPNQ